MSDDYVEDQDVAVSSGTTPSDDQGTAAADSVDGNLSVIPEETELSTSDDPAAHDTLDNYFQHSDPEFQKLLDNIPCHGDLLIDDSREPVPHDDLGDRMPLSLLTAPVEELILVPPIELNLESHVELAVYPPETNVLDLEDRPGPGETQQKYVKSLSSATTTSSPPTS